MNRWVVQWGFGFLAGILSLFWTSPIQAGEPIHAWPILNHQEGENRSETDILWPLLRHERKDSWSRYALRPLLFSTESDPARDYRKTDVLWPLNTYRHLGPELTVRLFPVYWYGKSPSGRYHIIFPVYWNGSEGNSTYFHVWPFFGTRRQGGHFTEYSTLYPFFRYGRDIESGAWDLDAPWPLVNIHREAGYLSHRVLPFYWYERGREQSGGFVFPFYWRNTPSAASRGIFPVWYSSRGPDLKTSLVFPVYYDRETPKIHLRMITPLYFSRDADGNHLSTLFPLYLDYRKEDFGIQIGLPAYLRYRSGPSSFAVLFPFYYHSADTSLQSDFSYYFPLYGSYRRGETLSRHYFLFPLYSRLEDERIQLKGWDVVWPVFHYESSPSTRAIRALPFYWHAATPEYRLTAAFPFYFSYSSDANAYRHFIPFYGVHTGKDGRTKRFILGPLFMDTRNPMTGLSRQDVVYPLYSRMKEGETARSWLIPFHYHREDADSRLTLGSLALLPPYYVRYQESGNDVFHIWPFYGQSRRHNYREYDTLWPLVRFGRDPERNVTLTHLLLYYRKREGDETFTTLFPIWRHRSTPRKTFDSSLVLHWYEHETTGDITRASFLWLIPPKISLVRYEQKPHSLRHALFPVYSYERGDHPDSLRWSLLWPLFSYNSRGEYMEQTGFLFKVISYEKKDAETSDFRFFWRFIRSARTATSRTFEFNPLYYYESEKQGDTYWAILGGLVGMRTTAGGEKDLQWLWVL